MGSSTSTENKEKGNVVTIQKKSHKDPKYIPETNKSKLLEMIESTNEKDLFVEYKRLRTVQKKIIQNYNIPTTRNSRCEEYYADDSKQFIESLKDCHEDLEKFMAKKVKRDTYRVYEAAYKAFEKSFLKREITYYEEKFPVTNYTKNNGLFECLFRAYQNHSGVVLRPNDLWSQVIFDFSAFVSDDPEAIRHVFVDHQGKKMLDFEYPEIDIPVILKAFQQLIASNLKSEIPLIAQFDSSDTFDMSIQNSMVMNTFKHYFEYSFQISCGITHVEFDGTDSDWKLLLTRLQELRNFFQDKIPNEGVTFIKYLDGIEKIYKKFNETRERNIDKKWWNSLYSYETFQNGYTTNVVRNGWIFDLFFKAAKNDMQVPQARTDVNVQISGVMRKLQSGFDGFGFSDKTYKPHSSILIY